MTARELESLVALNQSLQAEPSCEVAVQVQASDFVSEAIDNGTLVRGPKGWDFVGGAR